MVTGLRRHSATLRVDMNAVGRVMSAATVNCVPGWSILSMSAIRESLRYGVSMNIWL